MIGENCGPPKTGRPGLLGVPRLTSRPFAPNSSRIDSHGSFRKIRGYLILGVPYFWKLSHGLKAETGIADFISLGSQLC